MELNVLLSGFFKISRSSDRVRVFSASVSPLFGETVSQLALLVALQFRVLLVFVYTVTFCSVSLILDSRSMLKVVFVGTSSLTGSTT
jgi:hypothetical protein